MDGHDVELPLKGVRVLDLSRILAGPYTSMILSELGADVIKVEPPGGDDTRYWTPIIDGESVYFMSINRNKRSIVIDLKRGEGREIVYRLVRHVDVVIENYRYGVAERLGVDYESLRRIRGDIIYCSIHGFDPGSRYRDKRAADLIIQAMSGLMATTGIGEEPVRVSFALFDIFTGMVAASMIISALYYRVKTGKGVKLDVNLFDASIYSMCYIPMIYLATGIQPPKMGSAHPSIVPYQAFKCRDGRYMALGVFNDEMWRRLCKALGLMDYIDMPDYRSNPDRVRNRDRLVQALKEKFMERGRDEWIKILEDAGVTVGPVNSLDEVFMDPYISEAGLLCEVGHPTLGRVPQILFPGKINGIRPSVRRHPPRLSEDRVEILRLAGYSMEEIERLIDSGVVG